MLSEGDVKAKLSVRFELKDDLPTTRSTTDIIQKWCSHPDGVEDLALTLYVLFGSKYQIT
jgi:hypothetical protein